MGDSPIRRETWEYALVWAPNPEGDRFRLVAKSSRGTTAVWDEWSDIGTGFTPTKTYLVDILWRAACEAAERMTHIS